MTYNPKLAQPIGLENFYTDISLRDIFAGMAMQALVARGGWSEARGSVDAWGIADSMLERRGQ